VTLALDPPTLALKTIERATLRMEAGEPIMLDAPIVIER